MDSYGKVDSSRWSAEVQYFVDMVIRPELTEHERLAIGAAGLSEVADELIEMTVRTECGRLHRSGEMDMTVPVFDALNGEQQTRSRAMTAKKPSSTLGMS